MNFKVQGFYEEKRQKEKQVTHSVDLLGTFRGYKLDEIQIGFTIKCKKDLENLTSFLNELTPCFSK